MPAPQRQAHTNTHRARPNDQSIDPSTGTLHVGDLRPTDASVLSQHQTSFRSCTTTHAAAPPSRSLGTQRRNANTEPPVLPQTQRRVLDRPKPKGLRPSARRLGSALKRAPPPQRRGDRQRPSQACQKEIDSEERRLSSTMARPVVRRKLAQPIRRRHSQRPIRAARAAPRPARAGGYEGRPIVRAPI